MSNKQLTEKQKYALKLAVNIMDKNFNRYANVTYGNRATGTRIGFGEAINILEEMVKEEGEASGNN